MRRLFVREKIDQRLFGVGQRVRGIRMDCPWRCGRAIAADFGRKTILERKPGNAHGRLIEVFPVEEPQQSDRIRSVSER